MKLKRITRATCATHKEIFTVDVFFALPNIWKSAPRIDDMENKANFTLTPDCVSLKLALIAHLFYTFDFAIILSFDFDVYKPFEITTFFSHFELLSLWRLPF